MLASAEFTNETSSGWQEVSFGTAVPISANVTYVVSYFSDHGPFALDQGYFNNGPVTVSPLKAIKGVYRAGTTGFPSGTYNNTNYWVDPIFVETQTSPAPVEGATLFPETHAPTTFASGAYELGTRFRSAQSGYIQSLRFYKHPQDTGIHVGSLWDESGMLLGRVTFWNETESGWQEARLPNSVAINAHQDYIVSYHTDRGSSIQSGYFSKSRFRSPLYALAQGVSGNNGLYGTSAGQLPTAGAGYNYSVDVVFGSTPLEPMAPESEGSASSIWETLAFTPTISSDNQPVEVGVKFQSARDGYIQGIRYYKGTTNTGEHLGNLWGPDGTLLASAIFADETESGWQEVVFAESVPISANVTYVASYHTNTGNAAVTHGYFQSFPAVNAPLRTAQTGTSYAAGVYRYGPSGYPTSTYGNSNYWVDVMFADEPHPGVAPIVEETIFADTAQPASVYSNGQYVQIGVKVRANRDGIIHGMHYYNSDTVAISHTAKFWTKTGTLLASAQFTNTTTVGWQNVYFTQPVSITANTTYVMSYDTTRPHAVTSGGMQIPPPSNSVGIRALANGEDGGNSVYSYGTGFPTSTYNSNYWVDVIFSSVANQTVISSADMTDITNTQIGQEKLTAAINDWSETQGITVDADLYAVFQHGLGQDLMTVVAINGKAFTTTETLHLDGTRSRGFSSSLEPITMQGNGSSGDPEWITFIWDCSWVDVREYDTRVCLQGSYLDNYSDPSLYIYQVNHTTSTRTKWPWGQYSSIVNTIQVKDDQR